MTPTKWLVVVLWLAPVLTPRIVIAENDGKVLFSRARSTVGTEYAALRKQMLDSDGIADFLRATQRSSTDPTDALLAEILRLRIASRNDILKLEQEFHEKVFRVYHDVPSVSHPPQGAIVTLDGLLVPGEKTPFDLEPKRIEISWGGYAKQAPAHFESLRIKQSPLWGPFCLEILLKGWVPERKWKDPVGRFSPPYDPQAPVTEPKGLGIAPGPLPGTPPAFGPSRVKAHEYKCQAMNLMGKLGEQRACPVLFEILSDKAALSIHRATAGIALGRLEHKPSLPVLLTRCETTIDHIDLLEREAAFQAVVLMKDRSAIGRLQGIIDRKVAASKKRREDAAPSVAGTPVAPLTSESIEAQGWHAASAQRAIEQLQQNR